MKRSNEDLRKFGLVMTVPLVIIGTLLLWRERPAWLYLFVLAGFFLSSGLLIPRILAPVEFIWMKLALVLSAIMTRVILILTFYIIITPFGLLMRLFGKDLLKKKFKTNEVTYWERVEADGPGSRNDKPY